MNLFDPMLPHISLLVLVSLAVSTPVLLRGGQAPVKSANDPGGLEVVGVEPTPNGDGGKSPPNIIIFMVDDLGWNHIGAKLGTMGTADAMYQTPNIEKLANGHIVGPFGDPCPSRPIREDCRFLS